MDAKTRTSFYALLALAAAFLAVPAEAKYIGGVRPICSECQACGAGTCPVPNNTPANAPSGTSTSLSESNFKETYQGPSITSSTGSLGLNLNYDSSNASGNQARVLTTLGVGWTHSYNVFLFQQRTEFFRYDGDGRVTKYSPVSATEYRSTEGYFETLTRTGPGSFTLTQQDGTAYDFALVSGSPTLNGQQVFWLQRIIDRAANIVAQLAYSGGLLSAITDTYGRSLTLGYTNGKLTSLTDPNTETTHLEYDGTRTRLTKITDPEGDSVTYTYDSLYQMTRKVDRAGKVFTFGYQVDRPISAKDGQGARIFSQVNPANWATDPDALASRLMREYVPTTTSRTDGNGKVWKSTYDSGGYLTKTVGPAPENATTEYTYDPVSLKISRVLDANRHCTDYSYDGNGNLTLERVHKEAVCDEAPVVTFDTAYEYFPPGAFTIPQTDKVMRITYPNGSRTEYQYDALGNRTQEILDMGGLNLTTRWTYYAANELPGNPTPARNLVKTEEKTNVTPGGTVVQTTRYEYDAGGNRIKVTDPENHIAQSQYDPVGNRTCMIDGNGHNTVYQYDGLNRMTRETVKIGTQDCTVADADDLITEYAYDGNGNRTLMQRQANTSTPRIFQTTTYGYDFRNRLKTESRDPGALNLVTSYDYDGNDNRVKMTDPRGKVTNYAYDGQNRLVKITDALLNLTQTRYDPVGNRVCVIDANGHDTFYEYDALNRLTRETRKIGPQSCTTADADDILTQTFYDTGNPIPPADCQNPQCEGPIPGSSSPASMIDPENKYTYFKYDAVNRGVMTIRKVGDTDDDFDKIAPPTEKDWSQITQYDSVGNVLARFDANGNPTTYTYFLDNLVQTEANATGDTTRYTYDGAHNLRSVQSPGGNVTRNVYDERNLLVQVADLANGPGPLVARYAYDGIGNRGQQCDGNNNCMSYAYDAVNRLVAVTDAMGKTARYQYDDNGNLTKTLDRNEPVPNVVCYVYDDINRRVRQVQKMNDTDCLAGGGDGDADDVWTKTVYDKVGNVTELTTAKNDGGGTPAICNGATPSADCETTRYAYDAVNRLVQEAYPLRDATDTVKNTREFFYDKASNLVQRIDQNNRVTDYRYDDLYYLTDRLYDMDDDDHFSYDVGGRMLTACREGPTDDVADACPGWLVTFAYDPANRVLATAQNGQTVSYVYDIPNRKRTLGYPGGKLVVEQRDLRERLDTLNAGAIADYTYDLGNRVVTRLYGNGTRAAYTYNPNNWIVDLTHTQSDISLIAGFGHEYDNEGNKRFEDKTHDPARSEGYQYDDLYRLIHYKVGTLDLSGDVPMPLTQTQYDLDKLGNWDEKTVTPQVGPPVVEDRLHNAVNEITDIDTAPPGAHEEPAYDANGNWIDDNSLNGRYTYAYDQENRLIRVDQKTPAELAGTYRYDALSRRIVKVTGPSRGNSETRYFYDDARIVEEQNPANVTLATYTYGNYIDEVLTMERNVDADPAIEIFYYHQNALWSVEAITDDTQTVVERYVYDAYGTATITDGAGVPVPLNAWGAPHSNIGNPWMFTGRQLDEETGLYYYRARYYDPGKGRFLQRDPLGYVDSYNLYQYVRSNPVGLLDPYGYLSRCCVGIGDMIVKRLRTSLAFLGIEGLPGNWDALITDAGNSELAVCLTLPENPGQNCKKTRIEGGKKITEEGCCCKFDAEPKFSQRGPVKGVLGLSVTVPKLDKVLEVKGNATISKKEILASRSDKCPSQCEDDQRTYLLQLVVQGDFSVTIKIPTKVGPIELSAFAGAEYDVPEKECQFTCGKAPVEKF